MKKLLIAVFIIFSLSCNAQSDDRKQLDSLRAAQVKNDKELNDLLNAIQLQHDILMLQGKEDTLLKRYPVIDSLLKARAYKII